MNTSLQQAKKGLLEPAGLTETDLEHVLGTVLGREVEYADLYFQSAHHESFSLEDGIVKEGSHSIDHGVGVRAISGDQTGFAYSDDIILPALTQAAQASCMIAKRGKGSSVQVWQRNDRLSPLYVPTDPISSITVDEKVALLRKLDSYVRAKDSRVSQVMVSLSGVFETILVVASDGTLAADIRPLVRLNVSVVVTANDRRETGSYGGGQRSGYEYFLEEDRAFGYADEALRQALVNLDADDAPAGTMPVVLGPGWPGVLLHEAVGHGLEGDFNRKESSTFSNRIGELVASPLCTIVDDGTLLNRRGSLTIDDEGTPTQRTVLIENGILKGYMQDKLNAKLMKQAPTGNGRRESFGHVTMPRMTNTFMLPGKHTPEEIIASVEKGLYAVSFSGGSVDITSGKFVFSANEAYLIENGKITRPVKGATLIGDGPEVMSRISMVGNDLKLDSGIGTCGKEGQSVPVGVGQPTLKVNDMTVGGTKRS
ncbi:metalloprotease TldD [Candidatus Berkiella cookevillensis]|uniref:Protease TldD n=1 Tax=Candidatus Berkiella cookevillensis TaxID=437022 RepID=A0A0Q9YP03_9GAMM|nr:metalloprotease TldD [Candidatus Berkiella cookevillensis]MCS5709019.1 metalloprotease TldD [Candidatus Berkiella cookevillensis]